MEITIDEIIKIIREKKLCLEENLVRKRLKSSELTEEESKREFSPTELKQLCLRTECKVDMWKWNPVDEVRERLQQQGRFTNYDSEYCLNLIAATTNKYKRKIRYKDKDIRAMQKEDWCIRKRQSINLLKMWSNNLEMFSRKPDSLKTTFVKQPGHRAALEYCKNKSNTGQKLDHSYRVNVDLQLLKRKTTRNLHPSSFDRFSNNISLTSTQFLNSHLNNKEIYGVNSEEGLLQDMVLARDACHLDQKKSERNLLSKFSLAENQSQNINFELLQLFDKVTDSGSISLSSDTELADSISQPPFSK